MVVQISKNHLIPHRFADSGGPDFDPVHVNLGKIVRSLETGVFLFRDGIWQIAGLGIAPAIRREVAATLYERGSSRSPYNVGDLFLAGAFLDQFACDEDEAPRALIRLNYPDSDGDGEEYADLAVEFEITPDQEPRIVRSTLYYPYGSPKQQD